MDMYNYEDQRFLRSIRNWAIGIVVIMMLLGGVATVASRAFDLAWFPWDVKMKTEMIRNSNSYVTTQQSALRQLYVDYYSATEIGQKNTIINQMRMIADLIPDNVPADVAQFLRDKRS